MSHNCKALILHCIDFRLGKAIKKYLEGNSLLDNCDIVSVAGATKNLASPAKESDKEFVLRQIDISSRLHNICEVILMNHTDCGAYGDHASFASDEEERNRHIEELREAAEIVSAAHPELKITLLLAKMNFPGGIEFEKIQSN